MARSNRLYILIKNIYIFNELYLTSTPIFTTSNRYTNIVHLREKLERKCVSWYLGPRDKAALNRAIEELKDKLQQDSFQIFLEELEPWEQQHNLWNVTIPVKKMSPIRKADDSRCRSEPKREEAFADILHIIPIRRQSTCFWSANKAARTRGDRFPKKSNSPGPDRVDGSARKM